MPPTTPHQNAEITASGILSKNDGTRIIPSSLRPDGTRRKEIQIRPGYRPPEDVEVYKNRKVQAKLQGKSRVPGAEWVSDGEEGQGEGPGAGAGKVVDKNAKKKAAKKRAKEAKALAEGEEVEREEKDTVTGNGDATGPSPSSSSPKPKPTQTPPAATNPPTTTTSARMHVSEMSAEEKEKQAKAIRKKLRQANELKQKKDSGASLLPEQMDKVMRVNELMRQLKALGLEE